MVGLPKANLGVTINRATKHIAPHGFIFISKIIMTSHRGRRNMSQSNPVSTADRGTDDGGTFPEKERLFVDWLLVTLDMYPKVSKAD